MFNFILKLFRKPEKTTQPEPDIIDFFEEPFFDNSTEHFLDIIRVFVVITVQQFIFILISKLILNKIWKKKRTYQFNSISFLYMGYEFFTISYFLVSSLCILPILFCSTMDYQLF